MIIVKNTPNSAGAAICGDKLDFENLYHALHTVVGNEEEFVEYEAARIRILAVCYDIRHALMGHRGIEFVDNGLDEGKKREMSVLAPDKNVYLITNVLWPEILFVTMALNEFLELYARKQTKSHYFSGLFTERKVIWDISVAQVRLLQSAIAECLKQTVSEAAYIRMLNVMNGKYVSFEHYLTQYMDILNLKFIKMKGERRLKSIAMMAKRIVERGREYRDLEIELEEEARELNCSVDDLQLDIQDDFPDDIDW